MEVYIHMKKTYKLTEYERDLLGYGSNENCTADQYLKFLGDINFVKNLSLRKLNKYIDIIISARTNGIFIGNITNIILRRKSGFKNYKFINESEISEVF